MESEQNPRHDSEPALYKTQALPQGNRKVHKTSSEVLTKAKNRLQGRARDTVSLHAMSSSEFQDGNNVGLGILTQGRSEENDEFIKPKPNGIIWDKLNATDLLAGKLESGSQDSADKRDTKEYEVTASVHDSGLDKPGESTDLVAQGGTQGLADCADLVESEGAETSTSNSDRPDKAEINGALAWGEEQGLNSKRSCGNVLEATLTKGDKLATSAQEPTKRLRAARGSEDAEHKELKKDSSIENCDEEDIVKLSEEAGMEDEKSVSGKKGDRASNVDNGPSLLWERVAQSMHASQMVSAGNQLRNVKFAIANMMTEVINSYDTACGINVDRTLMLTQHTPHFLETQEVKKTFYMKEVTSAIAKLAEILMKEDSLAEFRELRDTTQTLYDLQTRKLYFEHNSSEPAVDTRVEDTKAYVCFLAVVSVGLVLIFNREWMAFLLLVLVISFCIFLTWRAGEKSVRRKKRKLRAKML